MNKPTNYTPEAGESLLVLSAPEPAAVRLKTTRDYFEASMNPASETFVPVGTYPDEQ